MYKITKDIKEIRVCLCRWHTLFPHRHDVLRLDAPGRRARRANARNAQASALQQDAHVRLSETLCLQ